MTVGDADGRLPPGSQPRRRGRPSARTASTRTDLVQTWTLSPTGDENLDAGRRKHDDAQPSRVRD